MPRIELSNVDLVYPTQAHRRRSLKDLLVRGFSDRASAEVRGLNNVSLQIGGGECVGVIGRNGAGKSTLLRAIAGVFPIANGERHMDGTICSLFDIAAGFEANATGLENIQLRAYLQGETPRTLHAKLPDLIEFTGLSDMLEKPLHCFSTGRIMLLSFAVALCCEPDILLIDEFLSTADLHVREKIVDRLVHMIRSERIVMIASHDLSFLQTFCTRVLWIDRGVIVDDGSTERVIHDFITTTSAAHLSAA